MTLATPLAKGSVRVRGRACLRTPTPDPFGSLPHQQSLAGRPVQRRFEAAEDPLADRLAAGPSGIDVERSRDATGHAWRVEATLTRVVQNNGAGVSCLAADRRGTAHPATAREEETRSEGDCGGTT